MKSNYTTPIHTVTGYRMNDPLLSRYVPHISRPQLLAHPLLTASTGPPYRATGGWVSGRGNPRYISSILYTGGFTVVLPSCDRGKYRGLPAHTVHYRKP